MHCRSGFAVNLAVALANKCQLKVGLLDADIYGPNVPIMMKLDRKPDVTEGTFFHLSQPQVLVTNSSSSMLLVCVCYKFTFLLNYVNHILSSGDSLSRHYHIIVS